LIICDYELGTLAGAVQEQLRECRDRLPLLVIDAHHLGRWRDLRPDVVTPNVDEAAILLGTTLPEDSEQRLTAIDSHRDELSEATGAGIVVVTLDRDGAVLLAPDQPLYRTWARPVADDHTAGAGDTFCAGLTLGLCVGLTPAGAAELGQAAADVAVRRPGTGVCGSEELAAHLSSHHEAPLHADALAAILTGHRAAGARIVFTNGCVDVVHRGHVTYLNQAKRLGDVLIVAVNSDASVTRLKGPDRPVNTASDRAAVLAALSCVDYVTVFEEDTPVDLLRRLRPDVYAKGGDYTPDMLVETAVVQEYGGEVAILDYVADQSTTAVLDRIRATATAGR
jgi:D-beta-D-heptose 7-phosphate kinase/D-beta-D-heptose 1-phosphate adenosyltransferase